MRAPPTSTARERLLDSTSVHLCLLVFGAWFSWLTTVHWGATLPAVRVQRAACVRGPPSRRCGRRDRVARAVCPFRIGCTSNNWLDVRGAIKKERQAETHEGVHERGVLVPALLLLHRPGHVPLGTPLPLHHRGWPRAPQRDHSSAAATRASAPPRAPVAARRAGSRCRARSTRPRRRKARCRAARLS
jgi:hypothetical protein